MRFVASQSRHKSIQIGDANLKYNASQRPGETAHRDLKSSQDDMPMTAQEMRNLNQFTSSLSFFMGSALTVLDAGLALNTQGSFVNGFTPFRAGVAFFVFSFRFSMPAILNEPVFFSSSPAIAIRPSIPM